MTTQAPAAVYNGNIDVGNCLVYISTTPKTSFSGAESATDWKQLGLTKQGSSLEFNKEFLTFSSGFPARPVKIFTLSNGVRLSGELLEVDPFNVAHALGIATSAINFTTKASSPTPSTVVSGSTQGLIELADATGFGAGKLIKTDTGASAQYGRIKSIAGDVLTMADGLSGSLAPAAGAAVAEVAKAYFDVGSSGASPEVAIKIVKTHIGRGDTLEIFILKAQAEGGNVIVFPDNGSAQGGIGYPFSFTALSDQTVESGNVLRWQETQN